MMGLTHFVPLSLTPLLFLLDLTPGTCTERSESFGGSFTSFMAAEVLMGASRLHIFYQVEFPPEIKQDSLEGSSLDFYRGME